MKLTALALCALLLVPGCARSTQASEQTTAPSLSATDESSPDSSPEVPVTATSNVDSLDGSFAELTSAIPGEVGVAITTDGGVRSFGPWAGGVAWSTIKVPSRSLPFGTRQRRLLHGAALASGIPTTRLRRNFGRSWESQRKRRKRSVRYSERRRHLDGRRVAAKRKEFTPFGQTNWSVVDQATFMAALPCLPDSAPVIDDMSNVAANQQWGMALRPDAATKGGWGPSPEGAYLVRQVATVPTENGHLGVALSALPQDGSFDSGVTQVGKLAEWVGQHLGEFTARKCPS